MKSSAASSSITFQQKFSAFFRDIEIPLVVAVGLVGLTFSTLGFHQYYRAAGQPYTWMDCIYQAIQLLSLNSGAVPPEARVPWMLEVGRIITPLVTFYAIIKALAAVFRDQIHLARIRFMRGQRIICGLGRKGWLLARQLRRKGQGVVIIEQDAENPHLAEARALGCAVVIGDGRDPLVLKKAGVDRAGALVAVCGEDNLNAEIAARLRTLLAGSKHSLTCTIHIEDPHLWVLLRELELSSTGHNPVRLEFFNIFENGAFLLADHYLQPQKESAEPGLLVVGLGRLGESLVINAARRWALRCKKTGERLKVLALDMDANAICSSLQQRFPLIRDVLELVPLEMDIRSAEFHRGDYLGAAEGACTVSHAFVCLEDDTASLNAGLNLLHHLRGKPAHVVVVQWEDAGFADLVKKVSSEGREMGLTVFGLLNHTCQEHLLDDGTHERLARAIHRVYRRTFKPAPGEPLAGSAHVDWGDLDEGYRSSNRHQADEIAAKLARLGYGLTPWVDLSALDFAFPEDEEKILAREEHIRWMNERRSQGWRYGAQRDNLNKLHPDLLDWDDPRFTDLAREKDMNTVRNIPAYLIEAGFQLYKIK